MTLDAKKNLSDLPDKSLARRNLALGSASLHDDGDFAPAHTIPSVVSSQKAYTDQALNATESKLRDELTTLIHSLIDPIHEIITNLGVDEASSLVARSLQEFHDAHLGSAAHLDVGTTSNTVAAGDDPRLQNVLHSKPPVHISYIPTPDFIQVIEVIPYITDLAPKLEAMRLILISLGLVHE